MEVSTRSIGFTPAELAEIERRQQELAKLIDQLAATETLQDQQELAAQLVPRFDRWVRARNRIQRAPARRPRVVAIIRPAGRTRKHRPGARRRTAASSRTSSADPGDADGDEHHDHVGHQVVEVSI